MGKRIKLIDLFYYIAWCFLLVGEFYIYKNNQIRNILSVIAMLFCILVIVMNKYTIKEFFYFIVFLYIAMNIKSNTNTEAVLILVIFIFASKNRIKKDLFCLIYLVQIIKFVIYIFLFTPYAYFINNLKDSSDWITPNGLGLLFFEIVAIYFCYKSFKNKIKVNIVERCTIIAGILIMYAYTGCKTAVVCTIFLLFSDKVDYLIIIGRFIRKNLAKIIICIIVFMVCIAVFNESYDFKSWGTFGARFTSMQIYLKQYQISMWGTLIDRNFGPLDLGYFAMVLQYGIVFSVLFFAGLVILIRKLKNNTILLNVLISMIMYMLVERSCFSMSRNPLLILFSLLLFSNSLFNDKYYKIVREDEDAQK